MNDNPPSVAALAARLGHLMGPVSARQVTASTPAFKEGWTGRKVWKSATGHVFRNLQTRVYHADGGLKAETAGEMFSTDSAVDFREQAVAWLKEHSELAGRTIERADWDEIYWHFKRMKQGAT